MADNQQGNSGEGYGDGSVQLNGQDKLFPQSLRSRLIMLLGMMIFTTAAVMQSYLQSTLFDTYNTQMSVLQSFELI